MSIELKRVFAVAVATLWSCAQVDSAAPARPAENAAVTNTRGPPSQLPSRTVAAPPTSSNTNADPKALAQAQDLLRQGLAAYHVGQYEDAENLLKRSITVYPFLAPANLALGKIFLLKGAANHDESLIQSARLMFDMAHNIDPALREPLILLELFKPRGN